MSNQHSSRRDRKPDQVQVRARLGSLKNPLRYRSVQERRDFARSSAPWAIGGAVVAAIGLALIWITEAIGVSLLWLNVVMIGMVVLGGYTFVHAGAMMLIDLAVGMRWFLIVFTALILLGGVMTLFGWS